MKVKTICSEVNNLHNFSISSLKSTYMAWQGFSHSLTGPALISVNFRCKGLSVICCNKTVKAKTVLYTCHVLHVVSGVYVFSFLFWSFSIFEFCLVSF